MAQTTRPRSQHGKAARDAEKQAARNAPPPAVDSTTEAAPAPDRVDRRIYAWFRAKPTERYPLAAIGGTYFLGEAAHLAHTPALAVFACTGFAAFAASGAVKKWSKDPRAGLAAAAVSAAGAWISAAAVVGVGGPHGAVTIGFGVLSSIAYVVYRRGQITRQKIQQRYAKREWHTFAHKVGLGGSHLVSEEKTRTGERWHVNTVGTGMRASQFPRSNVGERIAEVFRLPTTRIEVNQGGVAGDIVIDIHRRNPWAVEVKHPLLDATAELTLAAAGENDISAGPVVVGQIPRSGKPLTVALADEDGAQRIMIIAKPGSGKSVLINALLERITASYNAMPLCADLSKAKDMRRWRAGGAIRVAACGRDEAGRAALMLEIACMIIDYRAAHSEAVFRPGIDGPLVPVILDEIDSLTDNNTSVGENARKRIKYIASKGRSEGVPLVIAGQRGTAKWLGGADIRNIIDTIIIGKVARQSEVLMAVGADGVNVPDMTQLGEGAKGAFCVIDPDRNTHIGHVFNVSDLDTVERLSSERSPVDLEPGLVEYLGDKWLQLLAGGDSQQPQATPKDAAAVAHLDAEIEASIPEDLRDEWRHRMETQADIRGYVAGLEPVEPGNPDYQRGKEMRAEQDAELAREAGLDPEVRARVMALLARHGQLTNKIMRDEAGMSKSGALRVLLVLKSEGVIESRGKGRAAAWYPVADDARADADDTDSDETDDA